MKRIASAVAPRSRSPRGKTRRLDPHLRLTEYDLRAVLTISAPDLDVVDQERLEDELMECVRRVFPLSTPTLKSLYSVMDSYLPSCLREAYQKILHYKALCESFMSELSPTYVSGVMGLEYVPRLFPLHTQTPKVAIIRYLFENVDERMVNDTMEIMRTNTSYPRLLLNVCSPTSITVMFPAPGHNSISLSDYLARIRSLYSKTPETIAPLGTIGADDKRGHLVLRLCRATSTFFRFLAEQLGSGTHIASTLFTDGNAFTEVLRAMYFDEDMQRFDIYPLFSSASRRPRGAVGIPQWHDEMTLERKVRYIARHVVSLLWGMNIQTDFAETLGVKETVLGGTTQAHIDIESTWFQPLQDLWDFVKDVAMMMPEQRLTPVLRRLATDLETFESAVRQREQFPELVIQSRWDPSVFCSIIPINVLRAEELEDLCRRIAASGVASCTSGHVCEQSQGKRLHLVRAIALAVDFDEEHGLRVDLILTTVAPTPRDDLDRGLAWLGTRLLEHFHANPTLDVPVVHGIVMVQHRGVKHVVGITDFFVRDGMLDTMPSGETYGSLQSTECKQKLFSTNPCLASLLDMFENHEKVDKWLVWQYGVLILKEVMTLFRHTFGSLCSNLVAAEVSAFVAGARARLCLHHFADDTIMLLLARIFVFDPARRIGLEDLIQSKEFKTFQLCGASVFQEHREWGHQDLMSSTCKNLARIEDDRTLEPRSGASCVVVLDPAWREPRDLEQAIKVWDAFCAHLDGAMDGNGGHEQSSVLDVPIKVIFKGEIGSGIGLEKEGLEVLSKNMLRGELLKSEVFRHDKSWYRLGMLLNIAKGGNIPVFVDIALWQWRMLLGCFVGLCDSLDEDSERRHYITALLDGSLGEPDSGLQCLREIAPEAYSGLAEDHAPDTALDEFATGRKLHLLLTRKLQALMPSSWCVGFRMGWREGPHRPLLSPRGMHSLFSTYPVLLPRTILQKLVLDPDYDGVHSECLEYCYLDRLCSCVRKDQGPKLPTLCAITGMVNFLISAAGEEDLRKYLVFATGCSQITGDIIIRPVDKSEQRMPSAMTCVNLLRICDVDPDHLPETSKLAPLQNLYDEQWKLCIRSACYDYR